MATVGETQDGMGAELVAPGVPSLLVGAATLSALALVALVAAGPPAALAAVVGGVVGGLSATLACRGLATLLRRGATPERGRGAALVGFVLRHGCSAVLLFVAVVVLRVPAGWLLAGLALAPAVLVGWASTTGLATRSASRAPHS